MPFVQYEVEGAVALIRLDRPPVNALSEEMAGELEQRLLQARDPSVRSVVVTGHPHFAAGADIRGFRAIHEQGGEERTARSLVAAIQALETLPKPTIAAIHGYALGGGLELALGADFRFLAEDASVGQPEIALGIIPGAGGTQRLPRLVGFQRAKELIYSGRHVGAGEAARIGLADEVHPAERLLGEAMAAAARWASGPTVALGAAKEALTRGWGQPLERGIEEIERAAFDRAFRSEDAQAGIAAFIEKRKPTFRGR